MAQTNLIGKTILGYVVSEKLGSGAFGTVYKVMKNNASGQYIRALKHITVPTEKQYASVLNSMGGDVSKTDNYFSEMLNSIVSEIRILNDLSEKGVEHIVRYYENDIVTTDSPRRYDVFILMEYLTPLEDFMQTHDFLVRDVVKLGLDVLSALQSCHSNGVIHRDIKDDNIFVSSKGEYKIGDFGVSKVLKDSSKAESLKGTPNFLAPEVYLGKGRYTKSVDLYSLGIVLYRLLNYNRNPFLPHFPKQFYAQDEDVAFDKRMRGETPDLPSLGGERIGNVIIQAISNSSERFKTAEEFFHALQWAANNTPSEILEEKVKFDAMPRTDTISESESREYATTLGESVFSTISEEKADEARSSSINKYLFESIGERAELQASEVEPEATVERKKEETARDAAENTAQRVVNMAPPVDESEIPTVVDKKIVDKVVFFVPVVILLIGIIAYFIVIPDIYGTAVSFIDWLFANPQNMIDTLYNPNAVLPTINSLIGIKLFWWVWLAAFITSLFFLGRQLQTKPEPNAVNAILTKREPYLMIQEVSAALKQIKRKKTSKEFDALIYAVKRLEERLSVESDFGYGNDAVINCENNIARQLQFLLDTVSNMEEGDFERNISTLSVAITNINSLLRRRMELKKR